MSLHFRFVYILIVYAWDLTVRCAFLAFHSAQLSVGPVRLQSEDDEDEEQTLRESDHFLINRRLRRVHTRRPSNPYARERERVFVGLAKAILESHRPQRVHPLHLLQGEQRF